MSGKRVGKSYVSLRRIAELCGVSRMTVSRAFDPARPVSPELRERILAVAAAEGYQPDRMVREVMTTFARNRKAGYRETLAALWWAKGPPAHGYLHEVKAGLAAGAEFHGCRFDHFEVCTAAARKGLARVLRARGIRGVVVTPPMDEPDLSGLLPWEQFTAVAIGSSLRSPSLHRTQHNHHQGAVRVMEEIVRRGYVRPVLVVGRAFDLRAGRGASGAFLAWFPESVGRVLFYEDHTPVALARRLKSLRPDVVVSDSEAARPQVPARAGYVSMSVDPGGDCTGVLQQPALLASAAVDLLLRSRWRGETGVPPEPMTLMTAGEWHEGRTLRAAAGT
ncbi:MAG: LacI family DNA-binding transcriptional regulator [Verrucomicrobiota bacterium]